MRRAAPAVAALVAAGVLGIATAALGAATHSVTSAAAGVSATLTWSEGGGGPESAASEPLLSIHQDAWGPGTSLTTPVRSPLCSPCGVEAPLGGSPLTIADLEGNGREVVVVRLTTGGAHCCSVVQFNVTFPAMTGTYTTVEHDFGDPGMGIGPVSSDGHVELLSADDRFAYAFTPYAYSALPLQIWELREHVLVDVTRSFPAAIAADAARWLNAFHAARRHGRGTGVIAAWTADEELLGHRALVKHTLTREGARGNLRNGTGFGPSGRKFVISLMGFLKRLGYAAASQSA